MQHLFSPEGEAALAAVLRLRPLLAFDFDGTLAPIVALPRDARAPAGLAALLARLARQLPVAIVTGRAVADVRGRLGFSPQFVVGSHGAEDGVDAAASAHRHDALAPLRGALQAEAGALAAAGVLVEDKGLSVALHHRLAPDQPSALALIDALLAPLAGWGLHAFGGKMVVNVVAADAPDKAAALLALAAHCGAAAVLFAGDDLNDEPVFALAPAHWLTLRVGRDVPQTAARFGLDSQDEVGLLLQRLLDLLDEPGSDAAPG